MLVLVVLCGIGGCGIVGCVVSCGMIGVWVGDFVVCRLVV